MKCLQRGVLNSHKLLPNRAFHMKSSQVCVLYIKPTYHSGLVLSFPILTHIEWRQILHF